MDRDWTAQLPRLRGEGAVWRGRAWRWCLRRSERDGRLAARRGRPISPQNLRRLAARRWHAVNQHLNFLS